MTQSLTLPNHVAIIMDGNGRWAKQQNKRRTYGHRAGHSTVLKITKHAAALGIKSLTLYAFSSENWKRPKTEVNALMTLFSQAIKHNKKLFFSHQIKFCVIGDKLAFSKSLQKEISELELQTKNHTRMTLNIAANYGSRWDIVSATKNIIEDVKQGNLNQEEVTENVFNQYLSLSDQSEVDLLIRTGGEQRLSNYLLWQLAYSELYFTDTFWPDFNEKAFDTAIQSFGRRVRRFGAVD